jgi:subtilisin family serine protease
MKLRGRVAGAATAVLALTGGAAGVLSTSAPASAQDAAASHKVIVVYNNQDRREPASRGHLSARRAAFRATRAPVLAQLREAHSTRLHSYSLIDATSATVTGAEEQALKRNPAVAEVVPDAIVHLNPVNDRSVLDAAQSQTAAQPQTAPGGAVTTNPVCSATPSLEHEALSLMHADSTVPGAQTARSLGFTGAGVTVGFIADGLDTNNPDFIRNGKSIFTDFKDFTGLGTGVATGGGEAFGDASSIAAQGNQTYNLNSFDPRAANPCNIKIEGVAPGVNLDGLDIFGGGDNATSSAILDAINYAVTTDHVNVLNESFGGNPNPDDSGVLDLEKQANDAATAAGVTVTVSSGDAGTNSTIGSPSSDPNVISVGATDQFRSFEQVGIDLQEFPGITGVTSNEIAPFSSSGFEQDGRTIDVVAPGAFGWALCSTNVKMFAECTNDVGQPSPIELFGGTSESAPLTAGVAALVDQAYAKTHGTFPTPAVVKQIITSTAVDEDHPADQQGAGLVNAYQAVLAAESFKAPASAPTPQGSTLLKSADQLNTVDQPGTKETVGDTVVNNGATTEKVAVSARQLGAYTPVANTKVTLSDANSPKTPSGGSDFEPVTFTVPAGQDRLDVSISFQTDPANPTIPDDLVLVDPSGNLANDSETDGDGNFADAQVAEPQAGTWTAYVVSATAANGGDPGPVLVGAQVASYQPFGTVKPSSLTLAPGASQQVTLSYKTPKTPGDTSASLVFAGTGSSASTLGTSTVPVTIRSLIPSGNQSFDQSLLGGNGRSSTTGQSFSYQLDVASGTPELNASVALADNPNNPFTAFLIGPNGEQQAGAANGLPNGSTITNELGAQVHVLNPAPGAWTLVLDFAPSVSGTALSEPFTVSTNETAVPAKVTGGTLPSSTSTKLPAGKAVTLGVKVTNQGTAPEAFFLDGRLAGSTSLALQSLTGPTSEVPFAGDEPLYLVPTDSTSFSESATTTGTEPFEFDSSAPAGDPDIESTAGLNPTASLSANPLAQGLEGIVPNVTGAFGSTGATPEPVTTSMSVVTAPFDPAVSSPTGDLWQASTNPDALQSESPVIVGPGRSATIPVTITPAGAHGTKVSGTLYVDDENDTQLNGIVGPDGNQVAAIPYSYTIK